jgi:2-polyprenyl-3-methyl-5-hydroxy-6-metoxy-1,4-benzoquinol methylase
MDRKKHWNNIHGTKSAKEVSWYQPVPTTSLDFVKQFNLSKKAKIIDIGGGDSFFADHLLSLGYQDITVLDISEQAVDKAKKRLGEGANDVKWIVTDAANFKPIEKYDLWHDRAAFHFLTDEQEIGSYLNTVNTSIKPRGYLVIGTFSEQGPKTCSGIEIMQYSEHSMCNRFKNFFEKIECLKIDHETPSGSKQNFIFCSFRRIGPA